MVKNICVVWAALLILSLPMPVNAAAGHPQAKTAHTANHKTVKKAHIKRRKAPEIMLKNSTQKLSYAFGMQVADSLKQGQMKIDIDRFLLGFQDTMAGKKTLLSVQSAKKFRDRFYARKRQLLAEKNLKQARSFMHDNRKKKGVAVTSSGLQYVKLRQGYGAHPDNSSIVRVQYSGHLSDGTEFYSTYKKGRSVVLPVKGVIGGLGEALTLMTIGSRYRFFIPPELAYGDHGSAKKIEPNVALIYDVELLAIESPKF